MTWGEFKSTVRDFLLVDSQRKGRGVQNYINQLTRAAIIDLQRYVRELLTTTIESYRTSASITLWSATKQYAFGDIVTHRDPEAANLRINTKYGSPVYQAVSDASDASVTEPLLGVAPGSMPLYWAELNALSDATDGAQEGNFNKSFTKILQVYVRRFPDASNTLTKSKYHSVRKVDWDDRFKLLDGVTPYRSIAFGDDGFIYSPPLAVDEKLLIQYEGENHYSSADYFNKNDAGLNAHDSEEVVFDEREAKAVAEYVKAHLQREVDKDLNMYNSHNTQYRKERQEIYRERREYQPSKTTDPYPVSTATVGPYQVN
jgi:hypothetical protein